MLKILFITIRLWLSMSLCKNASIKDCYKYAKLEHHKF